MHQTGQCAAIGHTRHGSIGGRRTKSGTTSPASHTLAPKHTKPAVTLKAGLGLLGKKLGTHLKVGARYIGHPYIRPRASRASTTGGMRGIHVCAKACVAVTPYMRPCSSGPSFIRYLCSSTWRQVEPSCARHGWALAQIYWGRHLENR